MSAMNKAANSPKTASKSAIVLPERDTIRDFLRSTGKPQKRRDIAEKFGISAEDALHALRRRLGAMVRDGQLVRNRRGRYGLIEKMDLICGRVIAHPDAYGFLVPDGGGDDLFLSPREMRSLLHGDRAVVRLIGVNKRGKKEGALVEVVERANLRVVGRFYREGSVSFVVPDNKRLHQDILVPQETLQAAPGQFVVVEIVQQPDRHVQPVGKVVEIIGDVMDVDMAAEIAIRSYKLPCHWPDAVRNALGKTGEDLDSDELECELKCRRDFRSLAFVTIDGEDARDFDDAVFCERQGGGWRLLVAIADVAHYVKPETALDREARKRGTSVYFPRRVIPMLPEALSNGLCSLNPGVDRFSLVCELRIDQQGRVERYDFVKAVIRSSARLSYNEMAAMVVDRDRVVREKYQDIVAALDRLYDLYRILNGYRRRQALIEFSTVETRFEFSEGGDIKGVHPLVRNDAHRIIEEFMLSANVAAGDYLRRSGAPALYRVHGSPKEEKLEELKFFLQQAGGIALGGGGKPATRDYAALLEQVRGSEDGHLIEMMLLKSMPLAVYSADNTGHFGLGFEVYTHFTSPIRRYPDLLAHRAIGRLLENGGDGAMSDQAVQELGGHCSETERRAEEAARDVAQRMKCMYMRGHLGETFDGTITSVTSFGLFVELDDIYIEGLIHISALPSDYYHYDAAGCRLYGERSGGQFKMTERMRVTVSRVSVDEKKIDFDPVL